MIKFFRKIRQNLLMENKTGKYFKYAIGEIILVVIGILIALSINNWNEERKIRENEVVYLNNIKRDLQLSIIEIDQFVDRRNSLINSANTVMGHFNGKQVNNWNSFNKHLVDIYTWQSFYLIDNTYQELKYSGNFAIISNDSIKNGVLNLDLLYKKLKNNENHWRNDAEQTLHPGSYEKHDINSMSKNYVFQLSNGKMGVRGNLTKESFGDIFNDQKQKNGFAFASLNFGSMNGTFFEMKKKCMELISQINNELKK
ncbi:hypothetical protein BTO16_10555 [Polaribacter glomeratus]|uniref:Uncharacterized protein n=2 Tax=Polaribacter glomeratus TaxID=102 RepID=A0A2S7WFD6_9FLAO|nr:hypothetical protein BTO16_10555 [Polaribacter glomeratus]TXD65483.1 hypothetical protein ESX12_09860 [Polaribacter glomeratus]